MSFSSEDRVWAGGGLSLAGALVGAVLMGGALGLDDQNAGIMSVNGWRRSNVRAGAGGKMRDKDLGERMAKGRVLCGVALCVRRGRSAWELDGPFGRRGRGRASSVEAQLKRAKNCL